MSNSTFKPNKITIILLMALIVVSILLAIILVDYTKIKSEEPAVPNASSVEVSRINRTNILNSINESLDILSNKSIILSIQESEGQTYTMMYNSSGEAVMEDAQSGATTIFMQGYNTAYFGDTLAYGQDSEPLSILKHAVKTALSDSNIQVLKSVNDPNLSEVDDKGNLIETKYFIDMVGFDNIRKLYSYISDDFADLMIENLKNQISLSDGDQPIFRLYYVMEDTEFKYGGCYVYTGPKVSNELTWADLKVSWQFLEYIEVYDWKLEDRWYTIDWISLTQWNDLSVIQDMYTTLYDELTDMMNTFAEDNGIGDNESIDSSITDESIDSSITDESIGSSITDESIDSSITDESTTK